MKADPTVKGYYLDGQVHADFMTSIKTTGPIFDP
jgi:hypothetical protein